MVNALWIDDVRQPPQGWTWAKNSHDAIAMIDDRERFDTISFDHDLGGEDTGARVLSWMAGALETERWPSKVMVHSANPVGAQNLIWLAQEFAPASTLVQRVSVRGL